MGEGIIMAQTMYRGLTPTGSQILTDRPAMGLTREVVQERQPTALPTAGDVYGEQMQEFQHAQTQKRYFTDWAIKRGASKADIDEAIAVKGWDTVQRPVLPPEDKASIAKEAKTVTTDKGMFQWNPESQRYDIKVGDVTRAGRGGRGAGGRGGTELSQKESALAKADIIASKAEKAIEQSGTWTAGWLGKMALKLGTTPAEDLESTLDVIKSNLGFEELREMKAASPTGGALGQVTEREIEFLQSTLESLKQKQSEEQLDESLRVVRDTYKKIAESIRAWKKEQGIADDAPLAPTESEDGFETQYAAMPSGTEFTGPDGKKRRKP